MQLLCSGWGRVSLGRQAVHVPDKASRHVQSFLLLVGETIHCDHLHEHLVSVGNYHTVPPNLPADNPQPALSQNMRLEFDMRACIDVSISLSSSH